MTSKYPYKWVEISEEEKEERRKVYNGCPISMEVEIVKSVPDGFIMPKPFADRAEELYNFELREDDIWIVTYPKCGTTWTQETVWQIVNGFQPEAAVNGNHIYVRSPFVEMSSLVVDINAVSPPPPDPSKPPPPVPSKEQKEAMSDSYNWANNLESPRVIKTHMPFEFLPPKLLDTCKVIYVCRNVKDTCVSFFHHVKIGKKLYGFTGNFEQYAELFKAGYIVAGSYWYHLKSGWSRKNHPNMKFLWFEDMKQDHMAILKDLCTFTGYDLSEEKLEQLKEHLTIDTMRKAVIENYEKGGSAFTKEFDTKFFRKGEVGDWKNNYFEGEKAKEWDEWIKKNLEGTDIKMSFE